MKWYSDEFIRAIPKTDLHVHLDGSLRIPTLLELAAERGVKLPSQTEEGLIEQVFKHQYADLNEYLSGFGLTTAVMTDVEAIERIAYELAEDNLDEGVRYLEVRFAPQLHMTETLSFEEIMQAVNRGLARKRDEYNALIRDPSKPERGPEFEFGIIVCAMRFFTKNFSPYYRDLNRIHRFSSEKEIIQHASLELAKAAVHLRQTSDIQIVAFDLAGSEHGHPASAHQKSYEYVHRHFLNKTVHAGEAYGPESIFQALTDLHADRIGHGLHLFDPEMISDENISDPQAYLHGLEQFIADRRITIEVCLTSNMQTSPQIGSVSNHSLGKMLDRRLSVSFCTDNRLVSHTTVSNEIKLALDNFDIGPKQLKNIITYGFKRSFFYGDYSRKREYVRRMLNYYDKIEEEFGIDSL